MIGFVNRWVSRNAELFARVFLPNGKTVGDDWRVGDTDGAGGQSLTFTLSGAKAGLWYDFATGEGGSACKLVSIQNRISIEDAAALIAKQFGIREQKPFGLNAKYVHQYRDRFGVPVHYVLRTEDKQFPNYIYDDAKDIWVAGAPKKDRDMYRLDNLRASNNVLIVEGELKADKAAAQLPDWDVVSWSGGAQAVEKTNWLPIYDRKIFIWPDNDEPGMQAANKLKSILHTATILSIPEDKPKKWDVADATPQEIAEILSPKIDSNDPFDFLGFDETSYVFLNKSTNLINKFQADALRKQHLLILAPESWWLERFAMSHGKKLVVDVTKALDWINRKSQAIGSYQQKESIGSGVHLRDGKVLINIGSKAWLNGVAIQQRVTDEYVINSDHTISSPYDNNADFDYQQIVDAVSTLNTDDADYLLGWLCLAPICGALRWRPHIWLTGMRGGGKSFFMEQIMSPLLKDWVFKVGGIASTEAGIRRTLKSSVLPLVMEEAETEDSQTGLNNMSKILGLATSASTNSTAVTVQAGNSKRESFKPQSMMMFISTETAKMTEAQVTRITTVSLRPVTSAKINKIKFTGSFISRQVREMPRIMEVVEESIKALFEETRDHRFSDQYGSLLGAAEYIRSNGMVTIEEIRDQILSKYGATIAERKSEQDDSSAAKTIISMILSHQIREGMINYIVGDLIALGGENQKAILESRGMRIKNNQLWIFPNHAYMRALGEKIHGKSWFNILKQYQPYVEYNASERQFISKMKSQRLCKINLSYFMEQKQYNQKVVEFNEYR